MSPQAFHQKETLIRGSTRTFLITTPISFASRIFFGPAQFPGFLNTNRYLSHQTYQHLGAHDEQEHGKDTLEFNDR